MDDRYAPPAATLQEPETAPASVSNAVGAAFQCLSLPLIAMIVATSLPEALLSVWAESSPLASSRPFTFFALASGLSLLIGPLRAGLFISAARSHRAGESTSIGLLSAEAFGSWWRIFLAILLPNLLMTLGFILLVIPGLYFIVRFQFVDVFAFEGKVGPLQCAEESAAVVRGRFWSIALLVAIFLVPGVIVPGLVEGILAVVSELGPLALVSILAGLGSAFLMSMSSAAAWFYLDDLRGEIT